MSDLPTLLLIKETSKQLRLSFGEYFSDRDIRPLDAALLRHVYQEGCTTSGELQEVIGMAKATISDALNSLANKGYIEYRPSASDRREKQSILTKRGLEANAYCQKVAEEFETKILEGVDSDKEQIVRDVLKQILLNLGKGNP